MPTHAQTLLLPPPLPPFRVGKHMSIISSPRIGRSHGCLSLQLIRHKLVHFYNHVKTIRVWKVLESTGVERLSDSIWTFVVRKLCNVVRYASTWVVRLQIVHGGGWAPRSPTRALVEVAPNCVVLRPKKDESMHTFARDALSTVKMVQINVWFPILIITVASSLAQSHTVLYH